MLETWWWEVGLASRGLIFEVSHEVLDRAYQVVKKGDASGEDDVCKGPETCGSRLLNLPINSLFLFGEVEMKIGRLCD